MTTNFITRILAEHNIATRHNGDRLEAYEDCCVIHDDGTSVDVSQWVDVTDWTKSQLRDWLGY